MSARSAVKTIYTFVRLSTNHTLVHGNVHHYTIDYTVVSYRMEEDSGLYQVVSCIVVGG